MLSEGLVSGEKNPSYYILTVKPKSQSVILVTPSTCWDIKTHHQKTLFFSEHREELEYLVWSSLEEFVLIY